MNTAVKKEKLFLHYLVTLNDSERKLMLKSLTKSQVYVICGIVFNVLHKSFTLKKGEINVLRRFKKSLYNIVDKKLSFQRKKQLIVRRSKEIGFILKIVLRMIPI